MRRWISACRRARRSAGCRCSSSRRPPTGVWDRFHAYADGLAASGKGTVSFAAPFVPTIVGTDTYTDQLW